MDKITLEQIVPYLPYGLDIQILNYKSDYVGIEFSKINGFYMLGDSPHFTYEGGSTGKSFSEFKPILRPITDIPDDLFSKIGFADEEVLIECIKAGDVKYYYMVELYKGHFDVFGLIETGLAVDINSLVQEGKEEVCR